MLRDAFNEIRLHPGRFVATLLAIAISVGFIVAILVGVRTEENAVQRAGVLPVSNADVVVSVAGLEPQVVTSTIAEVAGVTQVEGSMVFPTTVTHADASAFFNIYSLPSEEFRWADLSEGTWPSQPGQIVLSQDGASKIGARVGSEITLDFIDPDTPVTVVGLTNDAPSLYASTAYVAGFEESMPPSMWVVKADDPGQAIPEIQRALGGLEDVPDLEVITAQAYRANQLVQMTGDFDVFRNLLLGFAGIALLVGMIIIANTFTILVTQRRRQIGLLRAVGASTGQVGWRLVIEGALLGLIGSIVGVGLGVGVAAISSALTRSLYWGLIMPWGELAFAVGVGVLATVLSVIGPSLNAARVSPLEALQVVPTVAQAKRLSMARAVICGLLALGAAALIVLGFVDTQRGLFWAVGGGSLLALAVLVAAPFYVPWLLRIFGRIFGFAGPTVRLAASNAARNPRRASATAVALVLAVGLVVTLQVGVSTMRTTALEAIDQRHPIDVTLTTLGDPVPSTVTEQASAVQGVSATLEIPSKQVQVDSGQGIYDLTVRDVNPARQELGLDQANNVTDGVLLVSSHRVDDFPSRVEVPGAGELEVHGSTAIGGDQAAVSSAVFAQVEGTPEIREVWIKLTDRTSTTSLNQVIKVLNTVENGSVGGGAMMAGILTQVVNVLLIVLTALLGVAVVIALVGVGNTLGLSVLERQRESALLRALGMQKSSLRLMLLTEAMLLALVGVGVGIVIGAAMGWMGVVTTLGMMSEDARLTAVFSVDMLYTGGLILVCVVAAALASILPGRRAANATPTEALAIE